MINLHIVLNTFQNDSRILKETESIKKLGIFNEIHVAAIKDGSLLELEDDGIRIIWRVPLALKRFSKNLVVQLFKYAEWKTKIVHRYKKMDIAVIHCHDLNALPVGVSLKKRNPLIKLVYDAHELETERNGMSGIRKKLAKILERNLILKVDSMITVSESISKWYKERYSIRIDVLRNIPKKTKISYNSLFDLKFFFNITEQEILFIYQGGLSRGRGIEELIRIFRQLNKNRHIVFMGDGPLKEMITENNEPNIHYKSSVISNDVVHYVQSADVGIYLMEDTCLNHKYSLPNKIFEHIQAGIPIIVNNLPDQKAIVDHFGVGWVLTDPNKTIGFLNNLDNKQIAEKMSGVLMAKKELSWENEANMLIEIYTGLL